MHYMWGYLMRRIAATFGIMATTALVLAAAAMASGDFIYGTEGQPLTSSYQTVDSSPTCTGTTVTINWGDGTSPTPGTRASSSSPVTGSHTYAEEGTFNGTVNLMGGDCTPTTGTNDTFTATISDATLSGTAANFTATSGQPFSGTVATFTDGNPGAGTSDFTATISWGDGSNSPSDGKAVTITQSGGGFAVNGTHTYATAGTVYPYVTINDVGTQSTYAYGMATVAKGPPQFTQCPAIYYNTGCQFLIVFTGGGARDSVTGRVAPTETVLQDTGQGPYEGADDALIGVQNSSKVPISSIPITVAGSSAFGFESDGLCNPGGPPLDPGCKVAPKEPAGTACGPQGDACSYPHKPGEPLTPEPGAVTPNTENGYEGPLTWFSGVSTNQSSGNVNFSPALQPGKSSYFSLESPPSLAAIQVGTPTPIVLPPPLIGFFDVYFTGKVYILLPKGFSASDITGGHEALAKGNGFLQLTEPRQLPSGTQIDARAGSIQLVAASGTGTGTQNGNFKGGLFSLSQDKSGLSIGLTTLKMVEGGFKGAPSYSSCKAKRASDTGAYAALSSKVLQTLHASAKGKFKTSGKYSAATVRGTVWTMSDRCDGTLTTVKRGTVRVSDHVRHVTVTVHAGHSYLARPR
jgi:hypothetical protein